MPPVSKLAPGSLYPGEPSGSSGWFSFKCDVSQLDRQNHLIWAPATASGSWSRLETMSSIGLHDQLETSKSGHIVRQRKFGSGNAPLAGQIIRRMLASCPSRQQP
jgi:hypothetical protein